MSKINLDNVSAGFAATTLINANNDKIETAVENTLSRDGTGPNQMLAALDMNGNFILNQANAITVEGFNWLGPWVTATHYHVGDVIQNNNSSYIAIVDHISGVFATDLAAAKWQVVASSASLPSQSGNAGKIITTDGSNASWASVNVLALPIGGGTLTGPLTGTIGHFTDATSFDGAITAGANINVTGSVNVSTDINVSGDISIGDDLTISGRIIPNETEGIKGTTTNNSAVAGSIGEVFKADINESSAVSLSTGIPKTITSLSLSAGDWDVYGVINFKMTNTTSISSLFGSSSLIPDMSDGYQVAHRCAPTVIGQATSMGYTIPYRRIQLSAPASIYLIATAGFSASTLGGWGGLSARRAR